MPSPHHVLLLCCLLQGPDAGKGALDRATGCPWGVQWGRGARVEVRRVWGVGGVVPMAAGGVRPHAFTASCYFALVSFARALGGAGASDRAAGCSWRAPWSRGARVDVRRVWGVGGVVPMAAGGMGPRAFAASYFLLWCLLPVLEKGRGLQTGLLVALGVRHGAEVRVSR